MNKTWRYQYGENVIEIKNTLLSCKMFINDKFADETNNVIKGDLNGKLDSGELVLAMVESTLISVKCSLYVGGTLLAAAE